MSKHKKYLLDVWANGAVTIRKQGEPMTGGLPVFSTTTREEAESIQVRHCRLSRADNETYFLNAVGDGKWTGDVDDLDIVTMLFDGTAAMIDRLAEQGMPSR